ncbi:LOW QUALITY PROTEIN: hypothetical protein GGTG_07160 [Gaeumannomyces tritici R3-111a-1]|uniref:Uncharacterized protein n=1 Tax=Gaeumannomyces tritici (strain R3-111a-1) TaxID=644352 RepID=J3P0W4_GAET3|nr:LOW QUALITY PROTEIN: hypothetical protein GGTG_07160 [Gaeumannomyces tritici R3-111a-1]EJT77248.1 LOW QUALITY PROTEIN: hypothetical protein GGTG_07160 [Gaeumannomyces tritici R3-111a-1]
MDDQHPTQRRGRDVQAYQLANEANGTGGVPQRSQVPCQVKPGPGDAIGEDDVEYGRADGKADESPKHAMLRKFAVTRPSSSTFLTLACTGSIVRRSSETPWPQRIGRPQRICTEDPTSKRASRPVPSVVIAHENRRSHTCPPRGTVAMETAATTALRMLVSGRKTAAWMAVLSWKAW